MDLGNALTLTKCLSESLCVITVLGIESLFLKVAGSLLTSFLKCNLLTINFTGLDMWLFQFKFKVLHEVFFLHKYIRAETISQLKQSAKCFIVN